ncbi:MAG: hypothetical protein LBH41_02915, partial [Rickettsiales bacterium]|nr:hypothetical protein [Rickettsiales bacterium]
KSAIDNATDEEFRDIAIIKLALLPEFSGSDQGYDEAVGLLGSVSRRRPLYYSAKFTKALLQSRRGYGESARILLDEIVADPDAPAAIKAQASAMAAYIKDSR